MREHSALWGGRVRIATMERRLRWRSSEMQSALLRLDEAIGLGELWDGLTTGRFTIVAAGESEQRCFLRIRQLAATRTGPPNERNVSILRQCLLGRTFLHVGIESNRAASTVALICAELLKAMGAPNRLSRAPTLLVMAAHVVSGLAVDSATAVQNESCATDEWLFSAERPEHALVGVLPPAELDVVARLLEGYSHSEIAADRGTSRRTIANQLASSYRRLGVSGRGELRSKLLCSKPSDEAPGRVEQRPAWNGLSLLRS